MVTANFQPTAAVGRTATYVVAASSSPAHVKRQADYVCDGVDDQVEIQAAIDASPEGGTVALTIGDFIISGTINLNKRGIHLFGVKSGAYQPIAGGGTVIRT